MNKNVIINYPQFISNKPSGLDLYEGKSQEKIADRLSVVLENESSCKIIGIDGGWGSGKSNVIKILEEKLKKRGFVFFIYDAWGYQEDLQRRSILEALTSYLTEKMNNLDKDKWDKKLKNLLAKKRETTTETVPKLSIGLIISALALILTPILNIATESLNNCAQFLIVSIPVLILCILIISYWIKEKSLKKAFSKAFYIYQDKQIENITHETVSEKEPTVREFRNWIQEISNDLQNCKLVLVFDNMDRLPTEKVQQLWSSIHLFFAETKYENISVIIPFDRQHIINAFKKEDSGEDRYYGNDFIDKTFNVVYRVAPPILSDWRKFFQEKFTEAFSNDCDKEECERVLQVYSLLAKDITPRKIIAFINELVSLKHLQKEIPDRYIALFVLAKNIILNNPIKEITTPSYLGATEFLYKNDEDLPKFIAALTYQIEAETALQVIYSERLKQALDRNDINMCQTIGESSLFESILTGVLPSLENTENSILCLSACKKDLPYYIWDNFYYKITEEKIDNQRIKDYQLHLIEKTRERKNYIENLLNQYIKLEEFNSIDYYNSINRINELILSKNLDFNIFDLLKTKSVSAEIFISLVEEAKDEFSNYKVFCDNKSLDEYFTAIEDVNDLNSIDYFPILVKQGYSFENFEAHLKVLIENNNNDIDNLQILYSRLKEIIKETPIINNPLSDSDIYNLFNEDAINNDFYYDLIAMRISKYNSFSNSYKPYFEDILKNEDEEIISKVSNVIEYYTTYGNLLINIENFGNYPLYANIVKSLMANPIGISKLDLSSVLKKFDIICQNGLIEAKTLIIDLNRWEKYKEQKINQENINTIIPSLNFFTYALEVKNELSIYCIDTVKEYLDNLKFDEWTKHLDKTSGYEIQLSLLLPNYEYSSAALDSIKYSLEKIAKSDMEMDNWDNWCKIVSKLNPENKYTVFRNIRDMYCTTWDISIDTFYILGEWLFEFGNLEDRPESLRRIFKTEIVRDEDCRSIISENKNKLIDILNNTDSNEINDFKSTIRGLLDNDDLYAIEIAKVINVKKSKKKKKTEEEAIEEKNSKI